MKPLIIVLGILWVGLTVYAQEGDFYLTHYSPENEQFENENFAIVQDPFGQMLFANARGVLKFDGRYWNLIHTGSTALAICKSEINQTLYVGCLNSFGWLEFADGEYTYTAIMENKDEILSISKILIVEHMVHFYGDGNLYIYDEKSKKISYTLRSNADITIQNIFLVDKKIYVTDTQKKHYVLENGKLARVFNFLPEGEQIVFSTKNRANTLIIGTDANVLYKQTAGRFVPLKLPDQNLLNSAIINDGFFITETQIIVSTNKGGCILLDIESLKTIATVNYYSGLPDDEVFAIGKDGQSGVWIAHEFGLSRLDYFLPFKCFSTYPGLQGHTEAAITFNGKVHVATSEGVFVLNKVNNYQEIKNLIKDKKKTQTASEENKEGKLNSYVKEQKSKFELLKFFGKKKKEVSQPAKVEEPPKEKKSIWNIFGKKKKDAPDKPKSDEKKSTEITKDTRQTAAPTTAKTKIIAPATSVSENPTSVNYYYKKLKGIDAKCRQIISFNNKLLVSSNNGIYEIDDLGNTYLINRVPVVYLYVSQKDQVIYAGVQGNRMISYLYKNNRWVENHAFADFVDPVNYIAQDHEGHVWVSSTSRIYRFKLSAGKDSIVKSDTFKIQNPFSDDVHMTYAQGKMYFVVSNHVYSYNARSHSLESDTTSPLAAASYLRLLHSENNILWFNNGKNWNYLSDRVAENKNFIYLRLFKDIQDIFIDKDNRHCWILTKGSNLYFFDMSHEAQINYSYNVFLRNIKSESNKLAGSTRIELEEDHTRISFNFINPQYLDNSQLQFQYKLEGYDDNWSEWSTDNEVTFNSLPTGKYKLIVRTKNALDQITESSPIEIRVNPPYWREWWFYLLEALFFGTLLMVSFVMNRYGKGNKNLSNILTFITLVLLVEFLNAIADNILIIEGSPVLSFLVHVLIALILFPFERLLHGIITNNIETKKIGARIRSAAHRTKKTNKT